MTRLRREYRVAEFADAHAFTELCEKFQAESYQRFADFDFVKMHHWVVARIESGDSEVFSCWQDGELIGGLIGMLHYYPYSNTLVAGDYMWYVVPEHRGGMVGVRLMKMFEDWALSCGAVHISTGATSGIHNERGMRLLERLGYRAVGTIMQKGRL
jgi:RimJ/RimL family protein N-acetyltransferase